MDEARALLSTIAADPDADLPRLVYADWLDDAGKPEHAEFVRTQVQLAHEAEWSPLAVRCKHFAPQLLTGDPWRETLPAVSPRIAAWHPETPFRRGLPDWLVVRDLASFLDIADEFLAETPVTSLSLPTSTLPYWQAFARRPWLRRVKALHFYGLTTPIEPLRVLADAPNASAIESITFESATSPAMPVVLTDLFASPLGSRLKYLALSVGGDHVGAWLEGLERLPDDHPLESLDLRTMEIGDIGRMRFLALKAADRLRRFHFRDQPLGDIAVRAFVLKSRGNNYREDLSLRNTNAEFTGDPLLRSVLSGENLKRLDLSGNSFLGVTDWDWLRELRSLKSLRLSQCRIGPAELALVLRSLPRCGLVELDLSGNRSLGGATEALLELVAPDLIALKLSEHGTWTSLRHRLDSHFDGAIVWEER